MPKKVTVEAEMLRTNLTALLEMERPYVAQSSGNIIPLDVERFMAKVMDIVENLDEEKS